LNESAAGYAALIGPFHDWCGSGGAIQMIMIEQIGLEVVENHLLQLGAGNHRDNMTRLRRFECHCSMALTEEEFYRLVFLQNDEVLRIAPRGYDRTLRAVAERAISLEQPRLSANWDLAENLRRMREKLSKENFVQEPLVICEARDGEQQHGPFYLQDGSHRALACATLVLLNERKYERQIAFCSMSKRVYQSLVPRTI
jgi:hypothetical protein